MAYDEIGVAEPYRSPVAPDEEPDAPRGPSDPIDKLEPGSELHKKVLEYLLARIKLSEDRMAQFYSRWEVNEMKMLAYINLPNYDAALKALSNAGEPPQPVSIVVPYEYATIWTVVTYLMHTFCGRKPIFQVGSYKEESVRSAQFMETVLQYNADHTRLIKHLIQYFLDGCIYGVGIMRVLWSVLYAKRSVWKTQGVLGPIAQIGEGPQRVREEKLVYEGNECQTIDPFMFFPDPRVPMQEANRKGEFVFWRSFEGEYVLRKAEAGGMLKWIDNIGTMPRAEHGANRRTRKDLFTKGDSAPGLAADNRGQGIPYHQIDQGTIEIVPKQLGLGDSEIPEKWMFAIANKTQIISAEPFEHDHDMHPVAVIEPSSLGYSFGQPALADFLGPIQDTMSWFINSHIHNVRSVLNNALVYDPNMIEEQDLKNPKPGKLIRLKRSAYGQDVRAAVFQLQVQDVTSGHVNDMQAFMRMGDALSAVNDNLRGIQEAGGRKTATEVRTSGEAGASRLAATARMVSAQGMVDIAEMQSINVQQWQTMEFFLQIVGQSGLNAPVPIQPNQLAGDFYYPVHDGALPLDRVALFDSWKEILLTMLTQPALAQGYDVPEIFEYVAELGGAKNLSQFRVTMGQPGQQPPPGAPTVGLPGTRAPAGAPVPLAA